MIEKGREAQSLLEFYFIFSRRHKATTKRHNTVLVNSTVPGAAVHGLAGEGGRDPVSEHSGSDDSLLLGDGDIADQVFTDDLTDLFFRYWLAEEVGSAMLERKGYGFRRGR